VQEIALIYQGSVDRAVVRMAEIFKPAIRRNSCAIVLVHNHPSGVVEPSPQDIDLTDTCIRMGKELDIAVVDHLIVGAGQWVSVQAWLAQQTASAEQQEAV